MIVQRFAIRLLKDYARQFPIIAIVGPRQVGKTTLVKEFIKYIQKPTLYIDLEKPSDYDKLDEPELFLSEYSDHCIIIDEIQRKVDLLPLLRSLVDENRVPLRFIILGSAGPNLLRKSSETLAGRIAYVELGGLNILEVAKICTRQVHHFRGGFPESTLAKSDKESLQWLDNFIITYIERDLPMLGLRTSPIIIRKLWEMLAWQNGNLINYQNISKSLGLSNHTIVRYIDFLENAYLIHRLQPYHFNIKKRLVKSPKIFIRDTGILHRLLRISNYIELTGSPFLGNSWESYVIEQIRNTKPQDIDLFFYRTHSGAEMDLVLVKGLRPVAAIEIKFTASPKVSKSTIQCINDLRTVNNFFILPKTDDYPVYKSIRACSLERFLRKYLPNL